MKKLTAIAVLILGIAVLAPAGSLAADSAKDRPIRAHGSGTDEVDLADLSFAIEARGRVSHLGRSKTHFEGVVTPGEEAFDIAGSFTIVAANGNKLEGTFTGDGTTDEAGGNAGRVALIVTGGTGRFKDASGRMAGPYTQAVLGSDPTTLTMAIDYSLRGRVKY